MGKSSPTKPVQTGPGRISPTPKQPSKLQPSHIHREPRDGGKGK